MMVRKRGSVTRTNYLSSMLALLGRESRRQLGVTDLVARQGLVWTAA